MCWAAKLVQVHELHDDEREPTENGREATGEMKRGANELNF